ncbi:MAG TPA: tetratricopeptide repeat protein, partial [Vicinamibacterales bacterium]
MRLFVCLVSILTVWAAAPAAQKSAFRDALIGFHSNLAGDFGDEGPVVAESLDRMASSLAAWDQQIRLAEQDLRQRLPTATAAERVRMHHSLAELYADRGRYADAVREIDAALAVDGARADVLVFRGLVFEAWGRQEDAAGSFRRASDLDRDDPVSAYLAASRRAGTADGNAAAPETAVLLEALARRLASVPPDRSIPLFSAVSLVDDGAAVTPVFSPALYAEGFTLVSQARYDEALASFRRVMAGDPLVNGDRAQAPRLKSAATKLRDGDAEGAIVDLEAAAQSAPRSSEIHRILAAAYGDANNDDKSIEHLETAVALARDDERANVALGRALAHAGKTDRAEQVLLNTIEKLPQSTDAHSALADLYENSERGRKALHELEVAAAFTVIAGKGSLYWRLADLEHRHLEYEKVIEPLTRRTRLNPNDARAHTDLGLAYTRVGRTDHALIELAIAGVIGPDDAETMTAIGQIHFDAGDYAAAEVVLRRAIATAPRLSQARYLLGHTLARLGRADESRTQLDEFDRLRTAANDDARQVFEVNMLRRDAARQSDAGARDAAVAAWQKVVERDPRNRDDRIALADALLRVSRPEAAVEHLETAARLRADADIYHRLADVYATLGRKPESAAARQTSQRL